MIDIYPAREERRGLPRRDRLPGRARGGRRGGAAGPVYWLPRMEDAERLLGAMLGEGDLLVTLGAGDVDKVAAALADNQRQRSLATVTCHLSPVTHPPPATRHPPPVTRHPPLRGRCGVPRGRRFAAGRV